MSRLTAVIVAIWIGNVAVNIAAGNWAAAANGVCAGLFYAIMAHGRRL